MYLFDSSICIYIINKHPAQVVEHVKIINPNRIKLSAISLAELEYGISKSQHRNKNKNALAHFVSAFDIIEFNDKDAEVFGLIRANLEKAGQVIGPYDMQIAAQAIARNLILVTNNTKELSRIMGLKIENWV